MEYEKDIILKDFEFTGEGYTEQGKKVVIKFSTSNILIDRDQAQPPLITITPLYNEDAESFIQVAID
ncbi:hypothetical protein [Bacillus sp. FJAT-22090]|uniref:hypothetical protein n=1 Tax=Bacillus sp. FJAT-22090 TaxID=1581038 RepID=UPI0011A29BF7|nr:hypothetical protein [Bacillus sp. FJAT-22090]